MAIRYPSKFPKSAITREAWEQKYPSMSKSTLIFDFVLNVLTVLSTYRLWPNEGTHFLMRHFEM